MDIVPKIEIKADMTESANETIKNLALPTSKKFGMALGNVVGLLYTATLPIELINVWAKRNYKLLENKINDIPEDKIKEVEPEIAIPVMEKLSYTSNEDLANAYANLLSNASNKDNVDLIHPGFINKIQNLAPDEAKLLEYLNKYNITEFLYIMFEAKGSNNEYITLSFNLTGLEKELEITAKQMAIHLENLVSLSILRDNVGIHKADESLYEQLYKIYENDKAFFSKNIAEKQYGELMALNIKKSYYNLTSLGKIFMKACTN